MRLLVTLFIGLCVLPLNGRTEVTGQALADESIWYAKGPAFLGQLSFLGDGTFSGIGAYLGAGIVEIEGTYDVGATRRIDGTYSYVGDLGNDTGTVRIRLNPKGTKFRAVFRSDGGGKFSLVAKPEGGISELADAFHGFIRGTEKGTFDLQAVESGLAAIFAYEGEARTRTEEDLSLTLKCYADDRGRVMGYWNLSSTGTPGDPGTFKGKYFVKGNRLKLQGKNTEGEPLQFLVKGH